MTVGVCLCISWAGLCQWGCLWGRVCGCVCGGVSVGACLWNKILTPKKLCELQVRSESRLQSHQVTIFQSDGMEAFHAERLLLPGGRESMCFPLPALLLFFLGDARSNKTPRNLVRRNYTKPRVRKHIARLFFLLFLLFFLLLPSLFFLLLILFLLFLLLLLFLLFLLLFFLFLLLLLFYLFLPLLPFLLLLYFLLFV